MAPLCGQPLSPKDTKVWQQAIALLRGLKLRNGFGEKDLTAAVGKALRRNVAKNSCEDCRVEVATGAAGSGGLKGAERSPWAGDS
jgi:hypothetical protein